MQISLLVPTVDLHFLMCGYTPLTPATVDQSYLNTVDSVSRGALSDRNAASDASAVSGDRGTASKPTAAPIVQKTSAYDILRRLIQPKNMMVSADMSTKQAHVYVANMCLLQGDLQWNEVQRGILRLREANAIKFAECTAAGVSALLASSSQPLQFNAYITRTSPYLRQAHRVSGLVLANHTSIRCELCLPNLVTVFNCSQLLDRTREQYAKMRKSGAYVEAFKAENALDDMAESADVVDRVVQHYHRFANGSFM